MGLYYKLNPDHSTEEVGASSQAEALLKDIDLRRVAYTSINNEVFVSTVFLVIDHSYGGGPPVLFETMVFQDDSGKALDLYSRRYHTWDEAKTGHDETVKEVMKAFPRKKRRILQELS